MLTLHKCIQNDSNIHNHQMFTSIRTLKSMSWGVLRDHASGILETTLLQRGLSRSLRSLGSLGSQFHDENSLMFMKCIYLFIYCICSLLVYLNILASTRQDPRATQVILKRKLQSKRSETVARFPSTAPLIFITTNVRK